MTEVDFRIDVLPNANNNKAQPEFRTQGQHSVVSDNVQRIVTVIKQVPPGTVATYGQIAKLAGLPRNARQVGAILKTISDSDVPWFRIVNSKGEISDRKNSRSQNIQRLALEEEDVRFDKNGRIRLAEYQWTP